jgi:hypothetical protein
MLHQAKEERQVFLRHALLVERENEIALAGVNEEVRVLDAFGDTLVGQEFADVVAGEKAREIVGRDVGIDSHARLLRRLVFAQRPRQREEHAFLGR